MDDGTSPSRRSVLAGLGAAAVGGVAGCVDAIWSPAGSGNDSISVTVKTVPGDEDAIASRILGHLRENLSAVGITTTHEPVAANELYQDILIDQDYDLFVTRTPAFDEPDVLRRLLHSQFSGEDGWQNPFNATDVSLDALLEAQLQATDEERSEHLEALFELLGQTMPFVVVAYPEHQSGRRTSFPDVSRTAPSHPIGYLDLLSREPSSGAREEPLRVGLVRGEFTEQLNPIAAASGRVNPIIGLLYDPLIRWTGTEYVPWLALDLSWDWEDSSRATILLRDGLTWHDGEAIDADDVVFTFEFIADTSLGGADSAIPAPRFRGRQTAISSVSRVDSGTVEVEFDTASRDVAERALTTPLLPKHIWEPRSTVVDDHLTEARTTENEMPVGSGMLQFDDRTAGQSVSYELFTEHVLYSSDATDRPAILENFPQYDGLEFHVAPVQEALTELLIDDEIDVTGSSVPPGSAQRIRENTSVTLDHSPPDACYLVGYNHQHPQLGDPRFRVVLSSLIDREYVLAEFLDGHGTVPSGTVELLGVRDTDLDIDDSSPVSFPGSDGELDVEAARSLFEAEGYQYADDQLLE
ncbi:ABC transporter substrate-binding protein [Halobacteria archaeon AArc-dxtr1]|nr:ABC transporter substrate-binding protein [Halobacteria archaeon AArc-dxtr1]